MYHVFQAFPQDIRQNAFDWYKTLPPSPGDEYRWRYTRENGWAQTVCPLGAIIHQYDTMQSMLPSSYTELAYYGFVLEDEYEQFVKDNDAGNFSELKDLADAMGVTYS